MTTRPAGTHGAVRTVLLDAGGVLLDLDYAYLRRLIEAHRIETREDELCRLEAEARREIHRHVSNGGRVGDVWRDYFHAILGRAGVPAAVQPELIDSLWEAHQRFGLWTVAIPGAPQTVAKLRESGYRIGVVSNAEGRVARDLDAAGYAGLLETVVDSHVVGVEKPDPAIFHIALGNLGVGAETAVYVGDVPAVDVQGARAAGLTPILLDRHELYPDVDVLRLSRIQDLPECLSGLA